MSMAFSKKFNKKCKNIFSTIMNWSKYTKQKARIKNKMQENKNLYCKVIDKKGRQTYNDQHEQGRSSEEGRVSGSEAAFPLMNALHLFGQTMIRRGKKPC